MSGCGPKALIVAWSAPHNDGDFFLSTKNRPDGLSKPPSRPSNGITHQRGGFRIRTWRKMPLYESLRLPSPPQDHAKERDHREKTNRRPAKGETACIIPERYQNSERHAE
jgi:hypothetical protein